MRRCTRMPQTVIRMSWGHSLSPLTGHAPFWPAPPMPRFAPITASADGAFSARRRCRPNLGQRADPSIELAQAGHLHHHGFITSLLLSGGPTKRAGWAMIETERLEHYRGQADLCWQIGARAVDAPDRDAWLLLALSWNNLANQAELTRGSASSRPSWSVRSSRSAREAHASKKAKALTHSRLAHHGRASAPR